MDSFHDCVLNATQKSLSNDELEKLFNTLPQETQGLAVSWGLNDTVFRDEVYEYLTQETA